MNAVIIVVVVGLIVAATILCLALIAGADALQSEEEQLMDDLEQERAIQKWIEEQQTKKDKDT